MSRIVIYVIIHQIASTVKTILQITDLHLSPDPDALNRGVEVLKTLRNVLGHIRTHHSGFDFLVLSGDLADGEQKKSYETVKEELGDWISRALLIPGNHDHRGRMRDVFGDRVPAGDDTVSFRQESGAWMMLGLDTLVPGEVGGRVEPGHLEWVEREVKKNASVPVLLFMHHPPVSVNCAWVDELGLVEGDAFRDLVQRSPNVRAVFAGHVHQEFNGFLGDVPVYTTPSTAMQFVPGIDEFAVDRVPPGYRVIELDGEDFRTRVVRFPEWVYSPE